MVHTSSKSGSPARLRDPATGRFIASPKSNRNHVGKVCKPGRASSHPRLSPCALKKTAHHSKTHHSPSKPGCSPCKEKLLAFMNYESPEDIKEMLLRDVSYYDKNGNLMNLHSRSPAKSCGLKKTSSPTHHHKPTLCDLRSKAASHTKPHSAPSHHSKSAYSHGLPPADRRSPSKHVSSSSSPPLNCTTWAGCVYSSMAQDAAAEGMKLKHGIDDMHKLLHTAKEEYPHIYSALRKDGNAWKKNPELVARVRKLYVKKVGSY